MWHHKNKALSREFTFADFKEALVFVNRVGTLAEQANHHPDIRISWNKVNLSLTSHDVGKVTERDHKLAKQIDRLHGADPLI